MMPFNPMMGQPPNKKKPGELIQNIKPLLNELMVPRWPRLVIGLGLVMFGRAAGLVAPASTRFLVDDIILKRHVELLAPLTLAASWNAARTKNWMPRRGDTTTCFPANSRA